MRDEAWIKQRVADLKAGVDELKVSVYRNQGAIKALEDCLTDPPPTAPSSDDAGLTVDQLQAMLGKEHA